MSTMTSIFNSLPDWMNPFQDELDDLKDRLDPVWKAEATWKSCVACFGSLSDPTGKEKIEKAKEEFALQETLLPDWEKLQGRYNFLLREGSQEVVAGRENEARRKAN